MLRRFREVHNGIFTIFGDDFVREFFEEFIKDEDPFIKNALIPDFKNGASDMEDLYKMRLTNSLEAI